jgi:hypothetical protein
MGNRRDPQVMLGLERLRFRGADVIALQEAGDRRRLIDTFCNKHDWHAFFGDVPGAPSVPILWKPNTVHVVGRGTRQVTPPTHVGRLGAGPPVMKAKVWNRIRVADGPLIVNGHIVPSVYLPARRRIARKQIDVLADIVDRRDGRMPVVAVFDANMRPTDSLTKPLRREGMVQRTRSATHGRRLIDHVWTVDCRGQVDVITMPSDHRAVLLTLI